ncbi:MAG: FkbM family methyltransferase [Bacteroidia bacterium]|nr:FkbM family methyltransferase [Bacteroidia bacterium]
MRIAYVFPMANSYQVNLSAKTKFLNFFRKLFTIPPFETLLRKLYQWKPVPLFKKMIPPEYLYPKPSWRTVQHNGSTLLLDISNVVDHGLYWGFPEPGYALILDTLRSAQVILDIGANIGSSALFFASQNPTAQILAFEPHPDTFQRAIENIRLNAYQNIELFNVGLGHTVGTLKLYEVNERNPGMNRILPGEFSFPYREIQIEVLDQVLKQKNINRIDFLKLDVEGFEYAVLRGAAEILSQSKPVLYIELDDDNLRENQSSAQELLELLYQYGYREFIRADTQQPLSIHQSFSHCHYDIIVR